MFGILAAGRLPNTAVNQLSESGFLLHLEGARSVNHLSVFMTGSVPFSEGFGGSIHIGWPASDGCEPLWQYLGFISNEKPSAVFRIAKMDPGASYKAEFNLTGATLSVDTPDTTALIGISVEPLTAISEKVPDTSTQPVTIDFQTQFISKMLESFSNHVISYELPSSAVNTVHSELLIPSRAVKSWLEKFQSQLSRDPMFWSK